MTTETKCPTCSGPALDRIGFWETCWTPEPVAAHASARIAHERANRLSARVKEQSEEIERLRERERDGWVYAAGRDEECKRLQTENAAMRGEITRLRARLSDAEIIGAAVRIKS